MQRLELDDQHCLAVLIDKATGEELGRTSYTIEEARAQGLIRDRSSWKTAPQRMLWARASKRVVDDFAPAVSLGILTPEETDEIQAQQTWQPAPEPEPDQEPEAVEAEVVEDEPAEPVEPPSEPVPAQEPEPEPAPAPPDPEAESEPEDGGYRDDLL